MMTYGLIFLTRFKSMEDPKIYMTYWACVNLLIRQNVECFDFEGVSSLEENMADWYMYASFRILTSNLTLMLIFNMFSFQEWMGPL